MKVLSTSELIQVKSLSLVRCEDVHAPVCYRCRLSILSVSFYSVFGLWLLCYQQSAGYRSCKFGLTMLHPWPWKLVLHTTFLGTVIRGYGLKMAACFNSCGWG